MAIRKEVLRRRGALTDAAIRAPGAMADASTMASLDSVLAWYARQTGGKMDLGLSGKVAMVAGASKGLGFAIAKALAEEGASACR